MLAAALLAMGGCGAERHRSSPTPAQFAAAAESVCRYERAKLAFIAGRARRLGRAPESQQVIRQQAAQSQLATARLQALAAPGGGQSAIAGWLTARTVFATVARDLAEAPAAGDAAAVADVRAELARLRAAARAKALALGIRACGEAD
jgi:hypothetical protein